jgi:hypothetical protein
MNSSHCQNYFADERLGLWSGLNFLFCCRTLFSVQDSLSNIRQWERRFFLSGPIAQLESLMRRHGKDHIRVVKRHLKHPVNAASSLLPPLPRTGSLLSSPNADGISGGVCVCGRCRN